MDMPPIGLGCSPPRGRSISELERTLERALDLGYRLFDTAEVYGTEPALGTALRRRRPSRDRLFIVSKVWQTNHAYRDVVAACEQTLRRLGLSFLDLYLVHSPEAWLHRGPLGELPRLAAEAGLAEGDHRARFLKRAQPVDSQGRLLYAEVPLKETWDAMQELEHRGLVRAIGVSNFLPEHFAELGGSCPRVNQIAHHPLERQADVVDFCQHRGIRVMAHSPLSAAGLLARREIRRLARRYARTPAQVVLRWNLELGVTPIPGTASRSHLAENLDLFDFSLRPEEVAALNALDRRRIGFEAGKQE